MADENSAPTAGDSGPRGSLPYGAPGTAARADDGVGPALHGHDHVDPLVERERRQTASLPFLGAVQLVEGGAAHVWEYRCRAVGAVGMKPRRRPSSGWLTAVERVPAIGYADALAQP